MDGVVAVGLVGAAGVVTAAIYGVVRSRQGKIKEPAAVPIGDTRVSDADWLTAGAQRYEAMVVQTGGTVEAALGAGMARQRSGDSATALFFYQKAIDLMQGAYVIDEMRVRRPSQADEVPIDKFLETLAHIREQRPGAPIGPAVLEVTHRLRTITTACKDVGFDPALYLESLDWLVMVAPDVDVSGVHWKNA